MTHNRRRPIDNTRILAFIGGLFALCTLPAGAVDPNQLPSGSAERVVLYAPNSFSLSGQVLTGIEGVYFDVGPFNSAFSVYRRGPAETEATVRGWLESAGIPLLTEAEYRANPKAAALSLSLHANADGMQFYFYSWNLTVSDKEPLNASSGYLSRPLWSNGVNGVVVPGQFTQMDSGLRSVVDEFVSAYQARNNAPE